MAELRFSIRTGDRKRFERATAKNVQQFVDELGRSFLRGAQRDSKWPVLTGASRRGFYVKGNNAGFEILNREEYAAAVEAGTRRRDGGQFIRKWWDDNRDQVVSDAVDKAFEE